jgi:hypothetical protein
MVDSFAGRLTDDDQNQRCRIGGRVDARPTVFADAVRVHFEYLCHTSLHNQLSRRWRLLSIEVFDSG